MAETHCGIIERGHSCLETPQPGAGLNLCTRHLLAAYDRMSQDVGVTDILPSPCLACASRLGVRYPSGWLCAICDWRVGELPDRDAMPVRVDVVYYVRYRDQIKIGTSGNPRGRLAQLSFDTLLAFERGDRTVEHKRHVQFASHRYPRSEWFRVHDALIEHIDRLAEAGDPWSRYAFWVSQDIALQK